MGGRGQICYGFGFKMLWPSSFRLSWSLDHRAAGGRTAQSFPIQYRALCPAPHCQNMLPLAQQSTFYPASLSSNSSLVD